MGLRVLWFVDMANGKFLNTRDYFWVSKIVFITNLIMLLKVDGEMHKFKTVFFSDQINL